ncbi:hypothetical protein CYMTET_21569 [Cymbomonas tetramitiformis]|uniref:Phytanoyl-CoA dioxygenase n=1 Tax=Cymbomonas tetramitiformis TaxID=36881 RepID=A0AAE0G1W4_9CHLO|nr:hypothetical protein CYMTET_21569 [Cymbomonas tetramitiformis]
MMCGKKAVQYASEVVCIPTLIKSCCGETYGLAIRAPAAVIASQYGLRSPSLLHEHRIKLMAASELVETLEDDGFVVLRNALPEDRCQSLRALLAEELARVIENPTPKSFSKINNPDRRHDLRLPVTTSIGEGLRWVLRTYRNVYSSLFTTDAPLVELGVITSHPGAERQNIHSDVEFDAEASKIYTTFVALQQVDARMGPTQVWAGTHTPYFCEFYKPRMCGPVDPYYDANKPISVELSCGDALIIDTRVMHCGGRNESEKDRMLFHFSFRTLDSERLPAGFTYHLLPEVEGMFNMGSFLDADGGTDAPSASSGSPVEEQCNPQLPEIPTDEYTDGWALLCRWSGLRLPKAVEPGNQCEDQPSKQLRRLLQTPEAQQFLRRTIKQLTNPFMGTELSSTQWQLLGSIYELVGEPDHACECRVKASSL